MYMQISLYILVFTITHFHWPNFGNFIFLFVYNIMTTPTNCYLFKLFKELYFNKCTAMFYLLFVFTFTLDICIHTNLLFSFYTVALYIISITKTVLLFEYALCFIYMLF